MAPGSAAHPSPASEPTQEPKKTSPTGFEQIPSFLLRSSFSRAGGVCGLQRIVSVLMARLLLDAFSLVRNNSPGSAICN